MYQKKRQLTQKKAPKRATLRATPSVNRDIIRVSVTQSFNTTELCEAGRYPWEIPWKDDAPGRRMHDTIDMDII